MGNLTSKNSSFRMANGAEVQPKASDSTAMPHPIAPTMPGDTEQTVTQAVEQ